MATNTSASDEMSALEGMLNSLTLKIKAGGEAASEAEQQLRKEPESMQTALAAKRDRVQLLEGMINGQRQAIATLTEKNKSLSAENEAFRAENAALRQHLDGMYDCGVAVPQRRPVCVRCWELGEECDLGQRCQSCISAEAHCVRKICDGYDGRCQAPGCPRMHRGEFDEEQRLWIWERGSLPPMDHRHNP